MIVHSSEYSTIYLLSDMSLIYSEWNELSGDLSEEGVKGEMKVILDKVEEYNPEYVIADTKKFKYKIDSDTQRWITRFFMADIIEMGVKRYAIIVPEELFAQLGKTTEGDEEIFDDFQVKYFENKDQAMKWLIMS